MYLLLTCSGVCAMTGMKLATLIHCECQQTKKNILVSNHYEHKGRQPRDTHRNSVNKYIAAIYSMRSIARYVYPLLLCSQLTDKITKLMRNMLHAAPGFDRVGAGF